MEVINSLTTLRQNITQNYLDLNEIIQDIDICAGPIILLHSLNGAGRSKISTLRKCIDNFAEIAKYSKETELLKEVMAQREQLKKYMDDFKTANIKSMLIIDSNMKNDLIKNISNETSSKSSEQHEKQQIIDTSSAVSDKLLTISSLLENSKDNNDDNFDTFAKSTDNLIETQKELKETREEIERSELLLAKYKVREFTDKVLTLFSLGFFAACVCYVLQKRLF